MRHEAGQENGADKEHEKEIYQGKSGKWRKADKSTKEELTEMKANDNYVQHLSRQIKDGIEHTLTTGRDFVLKLTRPDKITKPLKELRDAGKIKIQ